MVASQLGHAAWAVGSKGMDAAPTPTSAGGSNPATPFSGATPSDLSWCDDQSHSPVFGKSLANELTSPIVLDDDEELQKHLSLAASAARQMPAEVGASAASQVAAGQPDPDDGCFLGHKCRNVPGFAKAKSLLDGFDIVLDQAVASFKSEGFDTFEEMLQRGIGTLGFVPSSSTASARADDDGDKDAAEREQMFKKASEVGKFDMQTKIGQTWSREIQRDARLKENYHLVGKGYEAQRTFRKNWALQKFIAEKALRKKREESSQKSRERGIHFPIKVIFDKEGGDAAAAKATSNYIMTALQKHANNETVNGVPIVLFNTWSRRYEFLYVKKNYDSTHEKRWEREEHEAGDQDDASGGKDTDDDEAATPAPKKARHNQTVVPEPKKKVPKKKAVPTAEELETKQREKDEAAANRKLLSTKFNKVKSLKIRCDAAQSRWTDIITASVTPIWKEWATEQHYMEGKSAKDALDAFKASSPVWAAWAMQQGFEIYAKKSFPDQTLQAQLSRASDLEPLINDMEQACVRMLNMHADHLNDGKH